MKKTRKLLSLLLVLALAMAISPPAFAAGEITASLTNGTLSFSNIKTQLSNRLSDASYVTGLFVEPDQGTLYQGYLSEADPGAGVASSQVFYFSNTGYDSVDNITFVPNPNYIGNAEISFNVVGSTNSSGTIIVPVQEQQVSLSYSTNGDPIRFQADDFSAWCQSVTGRSIRSVVFTLPSENYGTLYYNYIDKNVYDGLVAAGTQYHRTGLPSIDNITFIPADGYSGTFTISFSGLDSANQSVSGQVRISVSSGSGNGNSSSGSDLTYSATAGQRLYLRPEDFSKVCLRETGSELNYIRFSSLPSSGTLYYDSGTTAVSTSYSYYYTGSSRQIKDVNFLADSGYEGTITIPFTAYSTQNTSFSSIITIEVSAGGSMSFSYTVRAGQRMYIRVSEIADACQAETGYQFSHVRFTSLPTSTRGDLYYNTTRITTVNRSYYRSSNDYLLENVNFLADDNYEGTFTIPFTAYSSYDGKTVDGVLLMEVTDAGSSAIRYTVRAGQRLVLNVNDFADACSRKTTYPLNYVRFTSLPASSSGVFYENGSTKVTTSTSYYRTATTQNAHLLENVSFVADANYSGTFSVPFTCYSSGGGSYSGTFAVTVTSASASQTSRIVYYSSGPAVKFSAADFSSATALSLSDTLAGVRFDAPSASAGKMYYAYNSPASHSTFVPGQSYSTALLSQISFLPRAGFSGTVSISYTATDNSGNTATGTVSVSVAPPLVSSYFNDMGSSSWAVPAVDFLRTYQIVNGVSATAYSPTARMRRGDFILMLSQAYANIFPSAGTASFSDVPQSSYYAAAIASARTLGIVSGDSSGRFYPNDPLSRQDAAVMLYRCMTRSGQSLSGTESVLSGFPDSGRTASYAIDAMAALVNNGIFSGDENGRLNPTATLTRAEMASILYRALTY